MVSRSAPHWNTSKQHNNFYSVLSGWLNESWKIHPLANVADIEDIQVTADSFGQCLRVEGSTHWIFDDSRQARSETIYHYAPYVGIVKAIARFILYDSEGLETVN